MAGDVEEVMIIGGGAIYAACLPMANKLYVTHIELRLLGLFESELAVVHDPADRRVAVRRDFHQVQSGVFGKLERFPVAHDACLFAIRVDYADLRRGNVSVAPRLFR